ncbi:MAG: hypothetical protein IM613_15510 [Cytophagales bacterium]|nr:hypothetical protein [Cytophagales bacterium]
MKTIVLNGEENGLFVSLEKSLLKLFNGLPEGTVSIPVHFAFKGPTLTIFDNTLLTGIDVVLKKHNNKVYFEIDPKSESHYCISSLPLSQIHSVRIHPRYKPTFPPIKADRSLDSVVTHLRELVSKSKMTQVIFEFSHPVFLPQWSVIPQKKFNIPVKVLQLKWRDEVEYKWTACLYVKPEKNLFHFPNVIPIQHLTNITLEGTNGKGKQPLASRLSA